MKVQISVSNKHHQAKGEYIGRGSPLGNPYPITSTMTRDMVIEEYDIWLSDQVHQGNPGVLRELNRIAELAMKGPVNLVCFCAPRRCHGDVIKRVICEAIAAAP